MVFANDFASLDVERCEQRDRAMARIVVSAIFHLSEPHREKRWVRSKVPGFKTSRPRTGPERGQVDSDTAQRYRALAALID